MNWIPLTSPDQIAVIRENSFQKPQVIFKHSTRCHISSVVWNRLENTNTPIAADLYYLDLLRYRPVSDAVATTFSVWHESPQLLLIQDGECTYDESHMAIRPEDLPI
ncbi:MAG TPA: bacillithiol system redox-active protein YtxJ [Sediminibacterium sp.]|nr:bacillithiol system redox-active protein YtxJ [Sediminibacterium sp.]